MSIDGDADLIRDSVCIFTVEGVESFKKVRGIVAQTVPRKSDWTPEVDRIRIN